MMEMLGSKRFSLLCAIINGAFAFDFLMDGSWLFATICLAACCLCSYNFWRTE